MPEILNLLDASSWNQVYTQSKNAVQVTPLGGYIPIPAFEVPVIMHSRVFVIRNICINTRPRWRFAGNLKSRVAAPIAGINSPPVEIASFYIQLNRTKLIVLPVFVNNYDLVLETATWLKDLSITIWEYVGVIEDTTEELIGVTRVDILRVEAKIDAF
ncbi:MAG: hypothetical protein V7K26_00095 [Nostoc sp.]|uniref:hypothetical protein n=1 Tax=Nostoc sp. TaxID=1180 RepID=UPI002FF1BFD6